MYQDKTKYYCSIFISGVYLWMVGQSDVSWPDGRSKTHFEYEIYMKEFETLWGQGKKDNVAYTINCN